MIDYFALALSHGLILLALIRLLGRDELDQEDFRLEDLQPSAANAAEAQGAGNTAPSASHMLNTGRKEGTLTRPAMPAPAAPQPLPPPQTAPAPALPAPHPAAQPPVAAPAPPAMPAPSLPVEPRREPQRQASHEPAPAASPKSSVHGEESARAARKDLPQRPYSPLGAAMPPPVRRAAPGKR